MIFRCRIRISKIFIWRFLTEFLLILTDSFITPIKYSHPLSTCTRTRTNSYSHILAILLILMNIISSINVAFIVLIYWFCIDISILTLWRVVIMHIIYLFEHTLIFLYRWGRYRLNFRFWFSISFLFTFSYNLLNSIINIFCINFWINRTSRWDLTHWYIIYI